MADDVRVRVAGRSFGYRGETYVHGDELSVDEATVENHPRTLARVEQIDDEDADGDDEDAGNRGGDSSTDGDGTHTRDDLEAMDYTDLQALAARHGIRANQSTEDLIDALAEVEG